MIRFGPAGNSDSFYKRGNKHTYQAPAYLKELGLSAYEYQCGRGVKLNENTAAKIKSEAKDNDIEISLHAPYYISLSSTDEDTRLKSLDYILQSAAAVDLLGGNRIVVHSGSISKRSREEALALAKDTIRKAQAYLDEMGYGNIHICPETMGKVGQLGTLEEVIELFVT